VSLSLTNLLTAKAEFMWSTQCQEAFHAVETFLCLAPVLAAPNFSASFSQIAPQVPGLQSWRDG